MAKVVLVEDEELIRTMIRLNLEQGGFAVPILMLTAKQDIDTRVKTRNHRAEDDLPKPFNIRELIARVNALLRRQIPNGRVSSDESLLEYLGPSSLLATC